MCIILEIIHVCVMAPLELGEFSARSAQTSVRPQAAATPAALLTIHRYYRKKKKKNQQTLDGRHGHVSNQTAFTDSRGWKVSKDKYAFA